MHYALVHSYECPTLVIAMGSDVLKWIFGPPVLRFPCLVIEKIDNIFFQMVVSFMVMNPMVSNP